MLQINNKTLEAKDLDEFKETPEGRFILEYLQLKLHIIAQTSYNAVKGNQPLEGYDLEKDRQIYQNILTIIAALSGADNMKKEINQLMSLL